MCVGPSDSLVPVGPGWASLSPCSSSLRCPCSFPSLSPTLWSPQGHCLESLRGWGVGRAPCGPGQPTAFPRSPFCLLCLSLLLRPPCLCLATAPQPVCTFAVTESIPWNNRIFQSAPFSLPSMMLGNPNQPGPKRLLQRDRALKGGPGTLSLLGPNPHCAWKGMGVGGREQN